MLGIGDAEPLRGEVRPAAVRVEDFARERVEAHRVDAEVPPAGGGREVEGRSDLDRESPMSRPGLVVAARQRKVGVQTVDADDPERSTHRSGSSNGTEDRLHALEREPEDLDVQVGRRTAEEAVAHLAPDEQRASARFPHRSRDVMEAGVDVPEVGPWLGPGLDWGGFLRPVRRHDRPCSREVRGAAPPAVVNERLAAAATPAGPARGLRPRGAQPAAIQIRLSWNGAPPTGAPGSAPVSALMPIPSRNARFGQMLSTITTPG